MTSMTVALSPAKPPAPPGGLVAGIDTHKSTHHVAILDPAGRPIADREFATTVRGCAQIVEFLHDHRAVDRVGVEGTGSYGAGISRALTAAGLMVVEVVRQNRQTRRLRGKSDPIDAHQAALAVLAGTDTAVPKSGDGDVESLRILMSERRSAAKARAQAMNQIHALLITAPDSVRSAQRHVANEIYAAPNNPTTDDPVGRELRAQRQRIGLPITVLAATLGVPYQRLRGLEIGTRAAPELQHRATFALAHIKARSSA